jgi:predicted outer membrane repeat protein
MTVRAGNRLTIEPGVDVLFNEGAYMAIEGSVNAVGTATDSIRFLKGPAATWRGLRITGGDSSTLAHVRISDSYCEIDGGGVSLRGNVRLLLRNTVISGNRAKGNGGGIHVSSSTPFLQRPVVWLERCTIGANSATGDGGGVYVRAGSLLVDNTVINGNSAAGDGGGVYVWAGSVLVGNTVISGNSAAGDGGGAYVHSHLLGGTSLLKLARSAVARNRANRSGGALYIGEDARAAVTQCTIANNSAPVAGAAVYVELNAMPEVSNSVIWGSGAAPIHGRYLRGRYLVRVSFCMGVRVGEGSAERDPLFVDAANGDFHLRPGSPCIDAGDPNSPLDPDGTRADIGAFPYDQRNPQRD